MIDRMIALERAKAVEAVEAVEAGDFLMLTLFPLIVLMS